MNMLQEYRKCVADGKAEFNAAGLLKCNVAERCLNRLRLEQGAFCKAPLLDENKGRRWLETPPTGTLIAKK
jgi:hypothetical protein